MVPFWWIKDDEGIVDTIINGITESDKPNWRISEGNRVRGAEGWENRLKPGDIINRDCATVAGRTAGVQVRVEMSRQDMWRDHLQEMELVSKRRTCISQCFTSPKDTLGIRTGAGRAHFFNRRWSPQIRIQN